MSKSTIEQRFLAAIDRAAERSRGASRFFRSVVPMVEDGVTTFMEAPRNRDVDGSDFLVCGFPYEGIRARDTRSMIQPGVKLENTDYARDGAWQAPAAIRRQSLHYSIAHGPGLHHYELDPDFRILDTVSIADAGDLAVDLDIPTGELLAAASDRLLALVAPDRIPILLGGDDITPYLGLRTVQRQRDARIAVIKFDAHFDLCWEPKYWAGSAWARAMEEGYLRPEDLCIVGIRGLRNPSFFGEVAKEFGIRYATMSEIEKKGIEACVRDVLSAATEGADYLYVSFDVDVMDPAFLPAQKYPEPAGMTAREAVAGVRAAVLEGLPLCGFDLDCLAPQYDVNGLGAQLAARLAVEAIGAHAYRLSRG